jgi:tetratricopeptide (TPR) repeat protein
MNTYTHMSLITITLILASYFTTYSQCDGDFSKNIKHGNVHYLATKSHVLVADYSIVFENSEEGITATITTTGYTEKVLMSMIKGDKLFFISSSGKRLLYDFISEGNRTTVKNRAVYSNTVQLNMKAMEWLAANSISQIRYVHMGEAKMYPFYLDASRQAELRRTATCFLEELDATKVKDKEIKSALAASNKDTTNNPSSTVENYLLSATDKIILKNYHGAIEDCNKAIEINPKYPDIYYNRAMAKLKLNDNNGACLDLYKAIELGDDLLSPDDIKKYCKDTSLSNDFTAGYYFDKGTGKHAPEDYLGAIQDFNKAIHIAD